MQEIIETIYTDGACASNGTKYAIAGVGVYYEKGTAANIAGPLEGPVQSNNRAELTAGLLAITSIKNMQGKIRRRNQRFKLRTDSALLLMGLRGGMERWARQEWTRNDNQTTQNADLWKKIMLEWVQVEKITIADKVAAHTGVIGNENADTLAVYGAYLKETRKGKGILQEAKGSGIRRQLNEKKKIARERRELELPAVEALIPAHKDRWEEIQRTATNRAKEEREEADKDDLRIRKKGAEKRTKDMEELKRVAK